MITIGSFVRSIRQFLCRNTVRFFIFVCMDILYPYLKWKVIPFASSIMDIVCSVILCSWLFVGKYLVDPDPPV